VAFFIFERWKHTMC